MAYWQGMPFFALKPVKPTLRPFMYFFKITFLLYFLVLAMPLQAQTLTSVVVDSATMQPVPYATVQINNKGVITNEEGRFTFLFDGNVTGADSLLISCIGYESLKKPLAQFTEKSTVLRPKAIELNNVIVSNKNFTADEIIDRLRQNIGKNYGAEHTKKRVFYRSSSFQRMDKLNYTIEKSTIAAFNKKFIDSIISIVPKSNSYYTEILGDLYGNRKKEMQKLYLIKASKLYDKSKELDFENLEEKFNAIIKKNVKTDSYFKIKSGLFGTKVDVDELFEDEVDSTDVDALNQKLEEKKKNEEDEKKFFAEYRRKSLGNLLSALPTEEDSDLNFIHKYNKYEFTLREFTFLDDLAVYVLDFKPKRNADFKGTLYVNSEDFALIRADYENVKPLKTFKLLGISMNEHLAKGKIIFAKQPNDRYGLRYFETENGNHFGIDRPLKIIEMNKVVKGKNKQNEFSVEMDLAFTNIEKKEVIVFETETITPATFDSFSENNTVLPVYMPNYDPEFWKGHTIIEPNQAIKEFSSTGVN